MAPFILKGAIKVLPENAPLPEQVYDSQRQLWIDNRTGVPLVISNVNAESSRFGETSMTEAREGVDLAATDPILASRYGETALASMGGGGEREVAPLSSTRFGETTVTRTVEGADNPESVSARRVDVDAPYTHF